ncbi:LemA family protein [Acinetobacter sp. ASP199]|uniref:LemA family protein n=1 Tax=unclassified Acinetobacter TaxID=196816 RepID=UPI001F61F2B3|nr:LemA family protein [Acinetobacter sp. ASP199]UNT59335.1 LemA family protein [Acinetobacter sp. ASP199]
MWKWILLAIVILIIYQVLRSYNTLQRNAQEIKEALSNISVSISKKVNLINQLMDVVKGYQASEQLVHLTVVKETGMNAIYSNYQDSNMMLTNLQGMAERYPDLKADQQYHRLISNIELCEKEISDWRNAYNERVKFYNTFRSSIPTIFIANGMGFSEAPYLDLTVENAEQTILKDFKTDDGERLNALFKSAKDNIVEGSKSLASTSKIALDKAADAGKKLATSEQVQNLVNKANACIDKPNAPKFFYLLPDSTPKGPVSLEDILDLAQNDAWAEQVRLSEVGTDQWSTFKEWEALFLHPPVALSEPPTLTNIEK